MSFSSAPSSLSDSSSSQSDTLLQNEIVEEHPKDTLQHLADTLPHSADALPHSADALPHSADSLSLHEDTRSTLPPRNRSKGRDVHIFDARDRSTSIGGLILTAGVTNTNLYAMIEIFVIFGGEDILQDKSSIAIEGEYILRNESSIAIKKDDSMLLPGNYYIHSSRPIKINNEAPLTRAISQKTGTRVQASRYARIMRTISNKPVRAQREEAIMLLGWLVCAKRPLKLHEVQTMKSINLEQRTVEFERRRFRVDPKDLCETLVDVRPDGSIELVYLTARVYLLKSKTLDIVAEEIRLATLCVDYLNLPCFTHPLRFSNEAVLGGNYGFMEYAILNWVRHLEAGLSSRSIPAELIKGLFKSFETLLENHWNKPTIEVKIPKRTRDILDIFQNSPRHKNIQQAIASMQEQVKRFGNIRLGECALNFTKVVAGIRTQLETVISDSADKPIDVELELKYGFIIDFATESQLARHIKEIHSASTDLGHSFPTEEEVNQSLKEYSPEASPEPEEVEHVIVEEPEPDPEPEPETQAYDVARLQQYSRPAKRTKTLKVYTCSYYNKTFTKRYNWKSHLETQTPSQPFTCSTCGTTCTRESDFK
ncbi:hypothetical protein EG329_001209 [Mollisiaceae sp. DMI_Dod_QoI]|nr:hypothetical protein EG329_001209 [Helotiales sp. DMI_Dod_QoI]